MTSTTDAVALWLTELQRAEDIVAAEDFDRLERLDGAVLRFGDFASFRGHAAWEDHHEDRPTVTLSAAWTQTHDDVDLIHTLRHELGHLLARYDDGRTETGRWRAHSYTWKDCVRLLGGIPTTRRADEGRVA